MDPRPRTPEETYGPALDRAQHELPNLKPRETAGHAGVAFEPLDQDRGEFVVPFFGQVYRVHWPQGSVWRSADQQEADIATRLLLLHYLLQADGTPMASKWIAFRNLPGGLGYYAAFESRAN